MGSLVAPKKEHQELFIDLIRGMTDAELIRARRAFLWLRRTHDCTEARWFAERCAAALYILRTSRNESRALADAATFNEMESCERASKKVLVSD